MPPELHPLSEKLAEAQREAARLRVEAFVDYEPVICGVRIRPVTLETWSNMMAFGNAFAVGGAVGFEDIVNFIWLHHPKFGQFERREKRKNTRQVWCALNPRLQLFSDLARTFSIIPRMRWLMRFAGPSRRDLFEEVVEEIRRVMNEATHDLPTGDDGDGEPMPFSFQAFVLNLFRRGLGMGFAETRSIPLKQLVEHLRELIHHGSRGKALLLTKKEAEVWGQYLGEKTEKARMESHG